VVGPNNEVPEHKFGRYYAYVLAEDDEGNITHINREMLLTGFAQQADYARHSQDSVVAFRKYAEEAEYSSLGMWVQKDSVGMIIQTKDAALLENLFPLNINTATQKELECIPTVGPGKATSIIEFRNQNGSFGAVEDLLKIKGIGPATLDKLRPYITVNEN
jgi:comEA protein